jgi:hypothetical protein
MIQHERPGSMKSTMFLLLSLDLAGSVNTTVGSARLAPVPSLRDIQPLGCMRCMHQF